MQISRSYSIYYRNHYLIPGLSGFGGNGVTAFNRCVRNGPFREQIWNLVPSASPQCLRREFFGNPPGEVDLALLMGLPYTSFTSFEALLSGRFHDNIHCLIGGTMCSFDAAAAPEFFLVHGMVDKVSSANATYLYVATQVSFH